METAADEQRGVVTAVAQVRVVDAAFEFDGIADPAAQADVQEVTVVIAVESATGVDVEFEVTDRPTRSRLSVRP